MVTANKQIEEIDHFLIQDTIDHIANGTAENQDPSVEEVSACESYLKRQVELLQPDLILALGSVTAQRLLKSKSTLSRLRSQLHYIDGINVPIIVSFDPAYLLRSPNEKRKAWDDLQMAMRELSAVDRV